MKRNIKVMLLIMLVLLSTVVLSGCTARSGMGPMPSSMRSADSNDYRITIIGGNVSPVTITYADMKSMVIVEKDNVTMVKANGVEVTSDFTGVPMAEILAKAGVPDGNVTFKMSAPDGYVMVYTRDQLEGSVLGLKRNGTTLTGDVNTDPIQLVMPGQRGALWIKVPVNIEIDKD